MNCLIRGKLVLALTAPLIFWENQLFITAQLDFRPGSKTTTFPLLPSCCASTPNSAESSGREQFTTGFLTEPVFSLQFDTLNDWNECGHLPSQVSARSCH